MHQYANLIKKYTRSSKTSSTISHNNIDITIFDQVKTIDPINGINDLFLEILSNNVLNLEDLMACLNLGIDPLYKDNLVFIYACDCAEDEVLTYLLNNYHFDIENNNFIINDMLDSCITVRSERIIKLLIDNGLKLSDKVIGSIIRCSHPWSMEFLFQILNFEHLLERMVAYSCYYLNRNQINFIIDKLMITTDKINADILSKLLYHVSQVIELTVNEIDHIINMGADPFFTVNTHGNNSFIHLSGRKKSDDVLVYFINNYGSTINEYLSLALSYAIIEDCQSNVELLLNQNPDIDDKVIAAAIHNPKYLPILSNHGVDMDRIAKMVLTNTIYDYHKQTIKFLIQNGVDFEAVLMQHL